MNAMNKLELVKKIAERTNVNEQTARDYLKATLDIIVETVAEGDEVLLVGFGRFGSKHRAERMGRNPKSGEPLVIKAKTMPTFKAGATFVDVLNIDPPSI